MTDDLNQIEDEFSDSRGIDLRNKLQDIHGTHPYSWFQWLFNHLHPKPGQRILDLGCGTAEFWLENEPRLWDDWFIVLGDRSPAMLQQAAEKLSSTPYYFSYCLLDAQQVALAPASFDTVLAVGLFDVLPEPERAFAEVHRLLRSEDGCTPPAAASGIWKSLKTCCERCCPEYGWVGCRNGLG
jgi:ubiquinone/menaquinone biosynthesis C-methylase UbiE